MSTIETDADRYFNKLRAEYFDLLMPLFRPRQGRDIIDFFASFLRIVGMEDGGWDPYAESRLVLQDLNSLLKIELPADRFTDPIASRWRLGLLFYSHLVEMDAIYEVIANLMRYHLGKKYSPNPFFEYLTEGQKNNYAKRGLYPSDKIKIIKTMDAELKTGVGDSFDAFYHSKLRNAISHSDYILSGDEFRCRNGNGAVGAFSIPLDKVDDIITRAKAFLSALWGADHSARTWLAQTYSGKAVPYDPRCKGLAELIVDARGLMTGFKVHWPNASESVYRRGEDQCEMTNMMLGQNLRIELYVGLWARNPGRFSPLVEQGDVPSYTPLMDGTVPTWPNDLL
jgi:hypothetical protein